MASEAQQLLAAIAALEAQRAALGEATVEALLAPARARLAALQAAAEGAQALRLVSILFLDVVGSTALSQRLEPEAVSALMDGALARGTALVQAHGGRVLQYAGDNLLAAFGADAVAEDDAERAVRCGLALTALGAQLGREVQARHGHPGVNVRVGIHTGSVLLGGGVDAAGTIRGMAVNVAARMEQSAPPGSLRVSVDTWRMVQGLFEAQPQPALQVKGVAEPLATWLVTGERAPGAALQRPRRGVEGVASPLVGREAERERLRAWLAGRPPGEGPAGSGAVFTLLGEAGLGKSRLLAEVLRERTTAPRALPVDLLQAGGHPQGQHQAYGLLRALLFREAGIDNGADQAEAQRRWMAMLEPQLGERVAEQGALLGQLLGLDYSGSPFVAGIVQDGRQLRERGLHALAQWLRRRAAVRPVLLVLDDLHWADEASLDALERLLPALHGEPLQVLCAARPELLLQRPTWGQSFAAHGQWELQPLAEADRAHLAQALLARLPDAPPALREMLSAQAAGNPFYMEALLQMLVDQGVIDASGPAWRLRADRLHGLQVPPTLVGVLQARLDALPSPARRALQQASVVGALFWDQALAALDAAAPSALPELSAHRLALPSDDGALDDAQAWAFAHHLLHQVTYGTVLARDRRLLHERAARWLQARSAGRGSETAVLVADHFERAGVRDQAAACWQQAAEEAGRLQADGLALSYARRALALLPEPLDADGQRRRFALLRVCCGVHTRRSEVPEILAALGEMEALADALDDDVLRLQAANNRMHRLSVEARLEEALALGQRWLGRAAARAGSADVAKLLNVLAMVHMQMGHEAEQHEVVEQGLRHARAAGDPVTEAALLNNRGVFNLNHGRLEQAEASLQAAEAAYRRGGSRYGVAITQLNLAAIAEQRGVLDQARRQLLALLDECRAIGQRSIEAMAGGNLGYVLVGLGEHESALRHARAGLALAEREGDRYAQANAHGASALAARACGLLADALAHAQQAVVHYAATRRSENAQAMRALGALLHLETGDARAALAEADALLDEARGPDGWHGGADAPGWLWLLFAACGDARAGALLDQARVQLDTAAAGFPEGAHRTRFLEATRLRRQILAGLPSAP